jgi:maltooligosyltrehalose trehalohydrolase
VSDGQSVGAQSVVPGELGATYLGDDHTAFRVWAPQAESVAVRLMAPREERLPLASDGRGYFAGVVADAGPGALYKYVLNGQRELPDPASRSQPRGVHGPSAVIDPSTFTWADATWRGVAQADLVFYELHVGTFTLEGTFDAIIPHLEGLRELGITAIELMPVAQFPGDRNWGYDGVYPYAVQDSYGGPEGLQRLVAACHARGLAVFLDVVYNHLGPEGNYLGEYGPYFTDRYSTPWGLALNFDGPYSDEVRRYFVEQALYFLSAFHLDGFRLDAVHAIADQSAVPFLQELATAVHARGERLGRRVQVIAESDLNDARLILPPTLGGYGLDGQWSDDLHHALHSLLTGERGGYYHDFGALEHLARAYEQGFVYAGEYAPHRQRRHGNSPRLVRGDQLVVCAQNHDQVGNRARGERLSELVPFERLKLAASVVLLAPFLPLVFMGEEYGEPHPFLYFTSHDDPALVEAVRNGRRAEFAAFAWRGEVPDPQDAATFAASRLQHELAARGQHRALRELYGELLRLRQALPALASLDKERVDARVVAPAEVLFVRRWTPPASFGSARLGGGNATRAWWAGASEGAEACIIFSFGDAPVAVELPFPAGGWSKRLDSADARWLGAGSTLPDAIEAPVSRHATVSPWSAAVYSRQSDTSL